MTKPLPLAREAMGNRLYKYTVAVSRHADGTIELVVLAGGVQGAHRMPGPFPEKRPFLAADLDEMALQAGAFLEEWRQTQPGSANQVTCCSHVVDNAIARARKKLATLPMRA